MPRNDLIESVHAVEAVRVWDMSPAERQEYMEELDRAAEQEAAEEIAEARRARMLSMEAQADRRQRASRPAGQVAVRYAS